jgi:hypothetical protein
MKKSKFQERLDTIAKNYDPEEDKGSMNDQVKLHKMTDTPPLLSQSALQWISVHIEKPPYYAPVNIWDGKQIFTNWARVSDGEKDYYVNSLSSNSVVGECKHNVTFWSYPDGVSYPKYEPMTAKDLPSYELTQLIKAMKKREALYARTFIDPIEYLQGIDDCIQIVERRLKRIQKEHKLKT